MLKYIIIDQNKTDRINLKRCLEQFSHLHLLESCPDIKSAEKIMHTQETDLVFFALPAAITELLTLFETLPYKKPALVAMAPERKYAETAFDVMAKGFILKPFTNEKVARALTKINRTERSPEGIKNNKALFIRDGNSYKGVSLQDIDLIEAAQQNLTIRTKNGIYYVHDSLKEMERKLPEKDFARISKSCIVRNGSISLINESHVIIAKKEYPLSPQYREQLLQKLKLI